MLLKLRVRGVLRVRPLTANFSLLASPGGESNGRRTCAVTRRDSRLSACFLTLKIVASTIPHIAYAPKAQAAYCELQKMVSL